jgi:predicted porin
MKAYLERLGSLAILAGAVMMVMSVIVIATPAKAWTGCGIGAFGSHLSGTAIWEGDPAGLGSNGQTAGVSVNCDVVLQKQFVLGAEASYAWTFGNLNDLGIDTDLSLTARAGYLFTPTTLTYVHGGWARAEGSGDHIDGIKYGLGIETKLAGTPMYLDLRWSHGVWDVPGASGVDVTTDEFRIGLKVKLGPDFMPVSLDEAPAKPVKGAKRLTP